MATTSPPSVIVVVESSGCLSQCNNGPNICIHDRVYGRIDGVLAAAAVLEVAANINCSGPFMAAIEDMATANKCKFSL
jgi:(2Fe-2S) ferredoxin